MLVNSHWRPLPTTLTTYGTGHQTSDGQEPRLSAEFGRHYPALRRSAHAATACFISIRRSTLAEVRLGLTRLILERVRYLVLEAEYPQVRFRSLELICTYS